MPIVDHVLRAREAEGTAARQRIRAIVVYPMNALANSQEEELRKFLGNGYPDGKGPVTFRRYTGQESEEQREEIRQHPPDILLTNYVMLEYILTRPYDGALVRAAQDLSFLVLDELHTYRGRQGSDVALLVRRVRDASNATNLRCVGTSATLAGPGTFAEQRAEVARIATRLFGATVEPANVIGETLAPRDRGGRRHRSRLQAEACSARRLLRRAVELTRRQSATRSRSGSSGRSGSPTTTRTTATCAVSREPITGDAGAATLLAEATGLEVDVCTAKLREALLAGSQVYDADGVPVFAFRLHQFFSGGSAVTVSLDSEDRAVHQHDRASCSCLSIASSC